jgi:hypothetical protein
MPEETKFKSIDKRKLSGTEALSEYPTPKPDQSGRDGLQACDFLEGQ